MDIETASDWPLLDLMKKKFSFAPHTENKA